MTSCDKKGQILRSLFLLIHTKGLTFGVDKFYVDSVIFVGVRIHSTRVS